MDFYRITKRLDRMGITASAVCAVHCALMPILITFLPLSALTFLSNEWVELTMLSTSLLVGVASLGTSYFKVHRDFKPVAFFLLGFVFILIGSFSKSEIIEPILLPIGGILFIVAHYLNYKRCKATHAH